MPQPIKQIIKDKHSELIKDEQITTLLVDGGSLLFMSFADTKVNSDGVHYGAVYQFLLQLRMQLSKKDYDYVYVFFDNEFSGWLRWNIYKPYKENRDKNYEDYAPSEYMQQCNANIRAMQRYILGKQHKKDSSVHRDRCYSMKAPNNGICKLHVIDEDYETFTVKYVIRYPGVKTSKRGEKKAAIHDILDHAKEISKQEFKQFAKNDTEYFIDINFDRERNMLCNYFNELFIRWHVRD